MADAIATQAPPHPHAPAIGTAVRMVPLFLLCYIVAQADKQAFGLTLEAIQRDIGITDTQIGLIQGAVFAVAFSLGGLPMGWLVDRWNRVHLTAICVTIWSMATALSGLARSFEELVLLRAVTAFFEAGLAPAAFSLFRDSLGRGRTARASATYMLAPFLGAGVAMIGGAGVGHFLPHWPLMARFGWTDTWRLIFLMIGMPGVALGLALPFLLRDSRAPMARGGTPAHRWGPLFAALFARPGFLRNYQLGMAMFVLFLSGYIAWFPTHLIRSLGYSLVTTGALAGTVYMIAGIAGTVFTISRMTAPVELGQVVSWLARSVALLIPVALLMPLMPWMWLILPLYALFAFLTATILAVMVVPLQLVLASEVQGRAIGVFTLVVTGIAGSLGPLLIGAITNLTVASLGSALLLVGLSGISGAAWMMRRALAAALIESRS